MIEQTSVPLRTRSPGRSRGTLIEGSRSTGCHHCHVSEWAGWWWAGARFSRVCWGIVFEACNLSNSQGWTDRGLAVNGLNDDVNSGLCFRARVVCLELQYLDTRLTFPYTALFIVSSRNSCNSSLHRIICGCLIQIHYFFFRMSNIHIYSKCIISSTSCTCLYDHRLLIRSWKVSSALYGGLAVDWIVFTPSFRKYWCFCMFLVIAESSKSPWWSHSLSICCGTIKPQLWLAVQLFPLEVLLIREYIWMAYTFFFSNHPTTICMLLTPPKSELHSWKRKTRGSKMSQNERGMKICYLNHAHIIQTAHGVLESVFQTFSCNLLPKFAVQMKNIARSLPCTMQKINATRVARQTSRVVII